MNTPSPVEFIEITSDAQSFFRFLPPDWAFDIEPLWPQYSESTKIYALKERHSLVAAGLLFSKASPDTKAYREKAEQRFQRGLLYLGFLYVQESEQKKGQGSLWMRSVLNIDPQKKYWLSVESQSLIPFYSQFGFYVSEEVILPDLHEWILEQR